MAEALKRPNKNKLKHEKIALHNKKSKNGGIPRIEHLQGHSFSPFFLTRHLQCMVVLLGCRLLAVLGWTPTGVGIICVQQHPKVALRRVEM